jgi:hypothetical protein
LQVLGLVHEPQSTGSPQLLSTLPQTRVPQVVVFGSGVQQRRGAAPGLHTCGLVHTLVESSQPMQLCAPTLQTLFAAPQSSVSTLQPSAEGADSSQSGDFRELPLQETTPQFGAVPGLQVPASHFSSPLHFLPSEQEVPVGAAAVVHLPPVQARTKHGSDGDGHSAATEQA